ncbi:MAG: hypothetical protein KGH75_00375 [Rhodospirillales bacterium]|nr:hypothetical protein [Rhodospirillales bacterium]
MEAVFASLSVADRLAELDIVESRSDRDLSTALALWRAVGTYWILPHGSGQAVPSSATTYRLSSFVCQSQPATIADAFNLTSLTELAATGANGATLAYYFYQSGRFNSSIDLFKYDQTAAPSIPTDADLVTWTAKAKSLGLRTTLKPHLQMLAGGGVPAWSGATPGILPGGLNQFGCVTDAAHPTDLGSRQVSGRQVSTGAVIVSQPSGVGTTAITATVPGNWQVGMKVTVAGAAGGTWSNINGAWSVTAVGAGTISFTVTTAPTGTYTASSATVAGPSIQVDLDATGKVTIRTGTAGTGYIGFTAQDVGRRVLAQTLITLYVINDATNGSTNGAELWFADLEAKLLHLIGVMAGAGGCDWVNLSTEQVLISQAFEGQFRSMIAAVRSAYPSIGITIGPNEADSNGGDNIASGFDVCHFWDALGLPDGLGGGQGILCVDGYMSVQTAPGDTLATALSMWSTWIADMATIRAAWQAAHPTKSFYWLFTEVGYPSCPGAGIHGRTITGTDGGADQHTCWEALIQGPGALPWFMGFNGWNWTDPSQDPTDPYVAPGFPVHGQPAETYLTSALATWNA